MLNPRNPPLNPIIRLDWKFGAHYLTHDLWGLSKKHLFGTPLRRHSRSSNCNHYSMVTSVLPWALTGQQVFRLDYTLSKPQKLQVSSIILHCQNINYSPSSPTSNLYFYSSIGMKEFLLVVIVNIDFSLVTCSNCL